MPIHLERSRPIKNSADSTKMNPAPTKNPVMNTTRPPKMADFKYSSRKGK